MNFSYRRLAAWTAVAAAMQIAGQSAPAGCPCQNGSGGSAVMAPMADPMIGPYSTAPMAGASSGMANPYGTTPSANGMPTTSVSPPASYGYPPGSLADGTVPGVGPGFSGKTATSWQPPPGTIGRTYQMKSRPVPVKMHPRAAIVDVRVPNAKNVRVHDMNVYRTQDFLDGFQDPEDPDVWHFTSDPLTPGLNHLYRIEAVFDGADGKSTDERYVRLIMGRVIEIEF